MARNVDYKKREEIATAAFELIRAQGVQNTSMTDIARALEMKRPTLYWYFKDLGAIFEVVLRKLVIDLALHLEASQEGVDHPIDRLDTHIRAMHGYFSERRDIIPCLLELWGSSRTGSTLTTEQAADFLTQFALPRRQKMIASLREGIEAGTVAPCDPEAIVHMVVALVDGLLLQQLFYPPEHFPPIHEAFWTHTLKPLKRTP